MADRRDFTNQRSNDFRSNTEFGFRAEIGSTNGMTHHAAFFNDAYRGNSNQHFGDRHRRPHCPPGFDNRFDPPLNMTRPPEPMGFGPMGGLHIDLRHRPFGLPDVSINIGRPPRPEICRPYQYPPSWQNVPRPYEVPRAYPQPYPPPNFGQRPEYPQPYQPQQVPQPYERPQQPYQPQQVPQPYERPPQQYQPQPVPQPYEQPQPKPKPKPVVRPEVPKPAPKPEPQQQKQEQIPVVKNADGSETGTYPDGSKLTKYPDGRAKLEKKDGTVMEKDTDGTLTTKYPDGKWVIKSPNGATTEVGPIVVNPPASDKGTTGDATSNGPPMKEDGDEKVVVTHKPDGTTVYTGEKSIVEVGPITVNRPAPEAPPAAKPNTDAPPAKPSNNENGGATKHGGNMKAEIAKPEDSKPA